MLKNNLLGFVLLVSLVLQGQPKNIILTDPTVNFSQLKSGFANPPSESRLRCYWWWLNSMATKESITRCLLYTSDAADEEDSVDLGGRRIIKKKKKKKTKK